jgi:type VI protein secretion system component VasF
MRRLSAATADEEAELRALSEQAQRTRRALAETADALAGTVSARTRSLRRLAIVVLSAATMAALSTGYLHWRRSARPRRA